MHRYSNIRLRRRYAIAAMTLGCALGALTSASAQIVSQPPTSSKLTPPDGSIAFLEGHAVGTQGYVCLPTAPGAPTAASWTVNNSRPQATLYQQFLGQEFQVVTHFLSPDTHPNSNAPSPLAFGNATWQSTFDSSKVWAQPVSSIPAGTDDSCPNEGAISCLLLQAIGTQNGPAGGRILSKTTFVQRVNTKGGSAPGDGCTEVSDVGKQVLVPYTADYIFWAALTI